MSLVHWQQDQSKGAIRKLDERVSRILCCDAEACEKLTVSYAYDLVECGYTISKSPIP